MYGTNKVIILPQMDYHLDLFIRPLDNKRVLLADDEMSVDILYKGLNKLKQDFYNTEIYNKMHNFIKLFETSILMNKRAQADEIEEILENNGFEVIRVPGRVYETDTNSIEDDFLKQYCNFINANALPNRFGDLVYITNKSNINELLGLTPELSQIIGFSFEEEFIKSISEYIDPEHIYFIDGDNHFISKTMLTGYQGGIHCACSEIPEGVGK